MSGHVSRPSGRLLASTASNVPDGPGSMFKQHIPHGRRIRPRHHPSCTRPPSPLTNPHRPKRGARTTGRYRSQNSTSQEPGSWSLRTGNSCSPLSSSPMCNRPLAVVEAGRAGAIAPGPLFHLRGAGVRAPPVDSLTRGWGSVSLETEIVNISAWSGVHAPALWNKEMEVARVLAKRGGVARVDIRIRIERRVRDGRELHSGDRPGNYVE